MQASACSVAVGGASGARCSRLAPASATPAGAVGESARRGINPPVSRLALALIDDVLSASGNQVGSLAGYCVTIGPGAFTALRVGIALVQGLALAHRKPVIGVCSLAALAIGALRAAECEGAVGNARSPGRSVGRSAGSPVAPRAAIALSVLDARMGECYYAAWWIAPQQASVAPDPVRPLALMAPAVGSAQEVIEAFAMLFERWSADADESVDWLLAGDGFDAHPELRQWGEALPLAVPGAVAMPVMSSALAEDLLVAALAGPSRVPRWRKGLAGLEGFEVFDDPPVPASAVGLEPLYIRDKVALDVDEQGALASRRQGGLRSPEKLAWSEGSK